MKEIVTDRLILRAFKGSDYGDLFEFLNQLKDNEFEGYPGITNENGVKYLNERLGSDEYYAIELKNSGKVIGNIYCGKRDFAAIEAGYIVNEKYRKNGYGKEALSLPLSPRFSKTGFTGSTPNAIRGISGRGNCSNPSA